MWRPAQHRLCISTIVGIFLSISLTAAEPTAPPLKPQIMSADKEAALRTLLPKVDDEQLAKILHDPRLLLYTEAEMPRAYQDWDGALPGIHSAHYNISANDSEPYGNDNLEFPWGSPGGTHRAKNVSTFRFLWLPLDEQGRTHPIVWYRNHFRGDRSLGYGWTFPVGTMIGEVLLIDRPNGGRIAFEVRVRMRLEGEWEVNVLRPFPRAEELVARIDQLRPDWQNHADLRCLVEHLTRPVQLPVASLTSGHPHRTSFHQEMAIDNLPPIDDPQLVAELLEQTPFRSAVGEDWREDEQGRRTVAPTTDANFHIIPANYDAGFIQVDGISCMRCHETVNRHVREFQAGRDWYGRVRGSDGIFSFHPFALSSISRNGESVPVRLRQELLDAGWLAAHDPERHSPDIYQRVKNLDQ